MNSRSDKHAAQHATSSAMLTAEEKLEELGVDFVQNPAGRETVRTFALRGILLTDSTAWTGRRTTS